MKGLRYIKQQDIDTTKWDDCIRRSSNGLIYAESVYLNHMADHWDGIVEGDYEAVMPVTWRRKLGIRYIYQPSFFQQGGIFSLQPVSPATTAAFLQFAAEKIKFAECTLNYQCGIPAGNTFFEISQRNNYILPLLYSYRTIYKQYPVYIQQRLKRLRKFPLQYEKSDDYASAIKLYQGLYQERLPSFSNKDYRQFEKLCTVYAGIDRLLVRNVTHTASGEILAVVLLLKDDHRLYNMASSILPEGKKLLANYFLYDQLIEEFAGSGLILDFEGSDIKGIAYFYSKFAKENQLYPFIRYNQLPAAVKLLKP